MRGAALLAGGLFALALAFTFARPVSTPGPRLRDFESYWAAGVSQNNGDDPYSRKIWRAERTVPGVNAAREETLPFVGPPFGLALWAQFARADYAGAAIAWSVVLALAFLTIVLSSLALSGGRISASDILAALVLAAAFGPLTSGLALGQVAIVACAASALTLLALRSGKPLLAGCASIVAALQPNVAIALAARLGDRRANVALVLGGAVAASASIAAAGGLDGAAQYVALLRDHTNAERFLAIQTTPTAVLRAFGANPNLAFWFGAAVAAGVLAILTVQCLSRRYGGPERYALAAAALPLAWPFAHEHDFALAFLPVVLTLRRTNDALRPAAAFATVLVAVDWLGLAQRPSALAQIALLGVAAAAATTLLARRSEYGRDLKTVASASSAIALILVFGWIARGHPLPIWPDTLPSAFSVDVHANIAATWALEQRAAGIDRIEPLWGALRALSLAGCALLWFTAARTLRRSTTERPVSNVPEDHRWAGLRT